MDAFSVSYMGGKQDDEDKGVLTRLEDGPYAGMVFNSISDSVGCVVNGQRYKFETAIGGRLGWHDPDDAGSGGPPT